MDPQISTSFIPKKPLTGERARGGAFGFIVIISLLIFIASAAAAGGMFLYGRILDGSLEAKKKSLQASQEAYDPGVIEELIRLDARMRQARTLLDKHVAPSSVFAFLSENTLEEVQFTSFDYLLTEQNTATIEMKGAAKDFSTVALQSDRFGASKMLREVVFADIAIGVEGGVTFTVKATIDLAHLLYSKYLDSSASAQPSEGGGLVPEVPTSSTTPQQ